MIHHWIIYCAIIENVYFTTIFGMLTNLNYLSITLTLSWISAVFYPFGSRVLLSVDLWDITQNRLLYLPTHRRDVHRNFFRWSLYILKSNFCSNVQYTLRWEPNDIELKEVPFCCLAPWVSYPLHPLADLPRTPPPLKRVTISIYQQRV